MPKRRSYVLLLRADQTSALGLLASGLKGAARQKKAIKDLGGKVISQVAVTGRYDIVIVADFPSPEAAYAFSMMQTGAGFYCETLEAFHPHQVAAAAELAESILPRMPPRKAMTDRMKAPSSFKTRVIRRMRKK
jgi:uncharacterized protein with GYD domain